MRSLNEHLKSPSLTEPPIADDFATEGCAGGSCGVLARFWITVESGRITACTARIRGRAAAFAAASAFAEAAEGRSVIDAARLGLTTLHPSFGELDEEDLERALVVEDAFHHALGNWFLEEAHAAGPGIGADRPAIVSSIPEEDRPAILVGMSGGVDSAVSLHRMLDAHDGKAAGATLRLWIDPKSPDPEAACCSPDSVRRARNTCHAVGAPHLSLDLRKSFSRHVVAPFIGGYSVGQTPNPCVQCNGSFRIDELVRVADVAGAQSIATGHYVRRSVTADGTSLIQRGVDPTKDQSYMLSTMHPETVARCEFPLGSEHKPEIRAEAAARGLEQAKISDSQEICFLGGGDYRRFLERADAMGTKGEIRLDSPDGEVLAVHEGVARFTRGQRRGIGVNRPSKGSGASPEPLYVLDVNPETGTVVVGDSARLLQPQIEVRGAKWHTAEIPSRVFVQLRYRSRAGVASANVVLGEDDQVQLEFDDPVSAPAPGQIAVFYDDEDRVVGAGSMCRIPVDQTTEPLPML